VLRYDVADNTGVAISTGGERVRRAVNLSRHGDDSILREQHGRQVQPAELRGDVIGLLLVVVARPPTVAA